MKKSLAITIIFLFLVLLTACAAGPNQLVNTPDDDGIVAGFWGGLWHGLVYGFAFIGSLFSDNIALYAVANNGGWYNFGFWLGAGGAVTGIMEAIGKTIAYIFTK